ncbi:MAG: hypothetical protein ABI759_02005 [Candidatus Solibacter sp.]
MALEILLPGFIGIANNGDFGKIYAWLCLAPRGAETNFVYFQPSYVYAAPNYWNSPYHSSQSALAWIAARLAGATHEGAAFDIRWLGALHVAIWLLALAVLLWSTRHAYAAILPVLIFTDVCYAAYLNSFYMDAMALSALLLMAASGIAMLARREGTEVWPTLLFAAAALLFATSKAQHAVWAILPAAFLLAWRTAVARGAGIAVLLAAMAILGTTDAAYRGQAMFNVLFYRLGPAGADLASLGVQAGELRYSGMHAYMEGVPVSDREWAEQFGRRTGFARLLGWYLLHPARTAQFLGDTLREGAPEMRPVNLSNFPADRGQPPGARTHRFAWWSDLRAALLRHWPWHLPLWYAVFFVGCLRSRSPLKWLALGCAVLGAGEFTAAALGDALDAGRHLFLFHAATDLTLCFAGAALIQTTMRHTP